MKTRNLFYLIGGITLFGFIGYMAAASNPLSPARPFRQALFGKVAQLGITDAQKTQIRGILRDALPTVQPQVKQYVRERRALRQAIHATPVNEAAIRAQAGKVAQLEADLAVRRAHISERVRAILTPDQIGRLNELSEEVDARIDAAIETASSRIAGP